MQSDRVIVVFCHSRAKLLDKCLKSIQSANVDLVWKILVVYQIGDNSVARIINKHIRMIDYLISLNSDFDFPLGNINKNRYIGTQFAFDTLGGKLVLGIEEDNIISTDSLKFIDFIYNKYRKVKAFRGINLGSIEQKGDSTLNGYSILRFGIHGSAGVLTDRSWKYIKKKKLINFDFQKVNDAWDARIEFYLKSGFMVTPNLSRNLDLGYGGTFAPASKNDPYFIKIGKSWVGNGNLLDLAYTHIQIKHNWRFDSISYKRINNLIYFIRRYSILDKFATVTKLKSLIKNSYLNWSLYPKDSSKK